jgi:hypothetical protein
LACLNWPLDPQLSHARLERGALHAQNGSSTVWTGDAPLGLPQYAEDVLALRFVKRAQVAG